MWGWGIRSSDLQKRWHTNCTKNGSGSGIARVCHKILSLESPWSLFFLLGFTSYVSQTVLLHPSVFLSGLSRCLGAPSSSCLFNCIAVSASWSSHEFTHCSWWTLDWITDAPSRKACAPAAQASPASSWQNLLARGSSEGQHLITGWKEHQGATTQPHRGQLLTGHFRLQSFPCSHLGLSGLGITAHHSLPSRDVDDIPYLPFTLDNESPSNMSKSKCYAIESSW